MRYHFIPARKAAYNQKDGQWYVLMKQLSHSFDDEIEKLYSRFRKQFGDFL